MSTFLIGFALGLSLIMAIGAQNAFVLKQGLVKQHVFWVCLICATSDAMLIYAGVFGLGQWIESHPNFVLWMKYFGATFLILYGLRNLISALKGSTGLLPTERTPRALKSIILLCLGFTWLNPHVYLDTVGLLGSISAQYSNKYAFACGAMSASFIFFFSLGYGARLLRPFFAKPKAWQILEGFIAMVMFSLAILLLWS